MTNQHTPGQLWTAQKRKAECFWFGGPAHEIVSPDGEVVALAISPNQEEHAHLIASAPDLLEFARSVLDGLEDHIFSRNCEYENDDIIELRGIAKKLISKATNQNGAE